MPCLPEDLQATIIAALPAVDLGRAACVCHTWRQLALNPALWRKHLEALGVSERPPQAQDCRQAYIAWTACCRYPPILEKTEPASWAVFSAEVGRNIVTFEDRGHLAIIDMSGSRVARVPAGPTLRTWCIVDDQVLTVSTGGILSTWSADGTLQGSCKDLLPKGIQDFVADADHAVTVARHPSLLCVTDHPRGVEIYRTELSAVPVQAYLLNATTLGVVTTWPTTLQIWRRDCVQRVRTIKLPSAFDRTPGVVMNANHIVVRDQSRESSSIWRLPIAGQGLGSVRCVQTPAWVWRSFRLLGETLLCGRDGNGLAVVDVRSGDVLRDDDLGLWPFGEHQMLSMYGDRLASWSAVNGAFEVRIWRFVRPDTY